MTTANISRQRDSASGPIAGFLFQFEKALLVLAKLNAPNEFVTIECVDDVASHLPNGTVIVSIQAKHTISGSGSAYGDTSEALWRTLQIWIEKIKIGLFSHTTGFVCCSNIKVEDDSLVSKFSANPFGDVIALIESLRDAQEIKLNEYRQKDAKSGKSIDKILNLIKFSLDHRKELEIIFKHIAIEELTGKATLADPISA